MSGGSESNFELGYAVNVDSHLNLLKATRATAKQGQVPVYVFVSSLAVYGGPKCTPESYVLPASVYPTLYSKVDSLKQRYTGVGWIKLWR